MSKKNNRRVSRNEANRSAYILHRPNHNAMVGGYTFTKGRDSDALKMSVVTTSNNSTEAVITRFGGEERIVLTGNELRTLQRVLNTHYGETF
jgi:hypothetical protein